MTVHMHTRNIATDKILKRVEKWAGKKGYQHFKQHDRELNVKVGDTWYAVNVRWIRGSQDGNGEG